MGFATGWCCLPAGFVCQLFFTRVLPGWEGEVERFAVGFVFSGSKGNGWGGFALFGGEGHGFCLLGDGLLGIDFGDGLIGIGFGGAKSSFIRMSQ